MNNRNYIKSVLEYNILDEVIGRGSFGEVRKAYDKNDELWAIKNYNKKSALGIIMAEKEFDCLKQIKHENIVGVKDFIETTNNYYLVLDYCNEGDIAQFCSLERKNRLLSLKKVVNIMKQILEGLRELHKRKIIHRDLKPQNILKHGDIIKIADFGLAKLVEKLEENVNNTICGTKLYMAKELLERKKNYDYKIDVYSCGIIFYQLLYGVHPYFEPGLEDHDFLKVLTKLSVLTDGPWDDDFSKLSKHDNKCHSRINVPDVLVKAITKMLCIEPDERAEWKEVLKLFEEVPELSLFVEISEISGSDESDISAPESEEKSIIEFGDISSSNQSRMSLPLMISLSDSNKFSKFYSSKIELIVVEDFALKLINNAYHNEALLEPLKKEDAIILEFIISKAIRVYCEETLKDLREKTLASQNPGEWNSFMAKAYQESLQHFEFYEKFAKESEESLLKNSAVANKHDVYCRKRITPLEALSAHMKYMFRGLDCEKLKLTQMKFLATLLEAEDYWYDTFPKSFPFPRVPDFESRFCRFLTQEQNLLAQRIQARSKKKATGVSN